MFLKYLKSLIIMVLLFSCGVGAKPLFAEVDRQEYQNVLDMFGEPAAFKDYDQYGNQQYTPLIDLGAWHGFMLPTSKDKMAGFSGPYVIAEEYGLYLGRYIEKLTLKELDTGNSYDFSNTEKQVYTIPGGLVQRFEFQDLDVEINLFFVSKRSSAITTVLKNKTNKAKHLAVSWSGKLQEHWQPNKPLPKTLNYQITGNNNGIRIGFSAFEEKWNGYFSKRSSFVIRRSILTKANVDKSNYTSSAELTVKANTSVNLVSTQSYYHTSEEELIDEVKVSAALSNISACKEKNEKRWQKLLAHIENQVPNSADRKVAVKSLMTLLINWRSPAGALTHHGISPSTTARWFNGFWAWDSWKHAYAIAPIYPALAKQTMLSMFAYQVNESDELRPQDAGMVVDAIFYHKDQARAGKGGNWNERNTKPPLATWAVWEIYQVDHDVEFLKSMFDKLLAYHQWWFKNRDHNQNGLVEYGATKHYKHTSIKEELLFSVKLSGKLGEESVTELCDSKGDNWYACKGIDLYNQVIEKANYVKLDIPVQHGAGWESGMDNAARFGFINEEQLKAYADKHYDGDLTKANKDWQVSIFENRDRAGALLGYSIDQESVELNSYLVQEKKLLAKMASLLGRNKAADKLFKEAEILTALVEQCFYDQETGFYYDRQLDAKSTEDCSGNLLVHRGRGPEGWAPLFTGIAPKEKAKRVINVMMNSREFNSLIPFPTASLANPAYHPDIYWRGRVWLDQFYFAWASLKRYGFKKEADIAFSALLNKAQGLKGDSPIRENYHPESAVMQGATNFSWSAAHLLMMFRE